MAFANLFELSTFYYLFIVNEKAVQEPARTGLWIKEIIVAIVQSAGIFHDLKPTDNLAI
jgi:hypothetical protein